MSAANDLTKTLQIYFDQTVEGFDASVVLTQQASQYTPKSVDMSRANNEFWRPQPMALTVRPGWDTTGVDPESLQRLSVRAGLDSPGNIEIALNLQELQDPTNMTEAVNAAHLQLAAHVDVAVTDTISKNGSLVVSGQGKFDWKMGATADAMMNEQGVKMGSERSLFLSPQHYIDIGETLAGKQNHQGDVSTAWAQAKLPANIAGFQSFQTDYSGFVAGNVATGITLAADTNYVPQAMKDNQGGSGQSPVDNRFAQMTIAVTGESLKIGDAFTVAGVYAVHHTKKTKTPRLKTFRVIDVQGTIVTYCPPIISQGPYQNVSALGASGAAITILNTADQNPSIFWRKNSVELIRGNFDGLNMQGGARFMKATTKKLGLPIAMLYWLDGKSVVYAVKWLIFFGVNNLNPEMNGIILPNQLSGATLAAASKKSQSA